MARISQYERSICLSDIHIPEQDTDALEVAKRYIKWFKPHNIFLLGDILDCYSISKFDKDPKRLDTFQDELDQAMELFNDLRTIRRDANIVFKEGNHCDRIRKFKWEHPPLASLRAMEFDNLLELNRFNIQHVNYKEMYFYKNICLEHGSKVCQNSSYTASNVMRKKNISGIMGHTHRLGTVYQRSVGGFYVYMENGCLCKLTPQYIEFPDWQQGFTIINHKRDGNRFDISQCCVTDGDLSFMGKEF